MEHQHKNNVACISESAQKFFTLFSSVYFSLGHKTLKVVNIVKSRAFISPLVFLGH